MEKLACVRESFDVFILAAGFVTAKFSGERRRDHQIVPGTLREVRFWRLSRALRYGEDLREIRVAPSLRWCLCCAQGSRLQYSGQGGSRRRVRVDNWGCQYTLRYKQRPWLCPWQLQSSAFLVSAAYSMDTMIVVLQCVQSWCWRCVISASPFRALLTLLGVAPLRVQLALVSSFSLLTPRMWVAVLCPSCPPLMGGSCHTRLASGAHTSGISGA